MSISISEFLWECLTFVLLMILILFLEGEIMKVGLRREDAILPIKVGV